MLIIFSERFADHVPPPGHPERVERAEIMEVVARRWSKSGVVKQPEPVTREQLSRIHAPEYLDRIAATAGRAVRLDPDTYTSPRSHESALLACGAAVQAVDHALSNRTAAFALVRPPGHHAERGRAMGFCLYNNVAVAAAEALERGLQRIAVIDYDVHHGNGTQWVFYEDPRVLYVSTHQYPFYPGTGAVEDVGRGKGEGFTFNVPLPAGSTDRDYELVFDKLIVPVLDEFEPQLLIVSAGYDAHTRDPLGGMRVSTQGFERFDRSLRSVAERKCHGQIAAVTEGGYDLQALAECLESTAQVLNGKGGDPPRLEDGSTERGARVAEAVRAAQKRFWSKL